MAERAFEARLHEIGCRCEVITAVEWALRGTIIRLTLPESDDSRGPRFQGRFVSSDGETVHLVFSGDDHFSVRRANLASHR